jgi:hypothetical protein
MNFSLQDFQRGASAAAAAPQTSNVGNNNRKRQRDEDTNDSDSTVASKKHKPAGGSETKQQPMIVDSTLDRVHFKTGCWAKHGRSLKDQFDKEFNRIKDDRKLITRSEIAANERLKNTGHVDVHARLAQLRRTFNSFGLVPTPQQRALFELMMMACLPRIVGPTWESRKIEIMRELNVKELPTNVHYIMPRQYGKTTGTAMGEAAIGYNVPLNSAIFSTGSRTARSLNRQIRNFVLRLPDGAKRLVVSNAEVLEISTVPIQNKKDARSEFNARIAAYPASGDSKCLFGWLV